MRKLSVMRKLLLQARRYLPMALALAVIAIGISLALPVATIHAQGEQPPASTATRTPESEEDRRILGEQTISGGSFVLRANETIRGDLTILGGSAMVEAGGRVEGDVNVFGGSADISGIITGDVNVLGGSITLRKTAMVNGGTRVLGGSVDREEGATVGEHSTSMTGPKVNLPGGEIDLGKVIGDGIAAGVANRPKAPDWPGIVFVSNGINLIANLILFTLISMLVVSLLPHKTERMLITARGQWLVSGGIGLLSFIAVPILIVLFAITICLIPAAIGLALGWVAGLLIGIAVVARYVGERLMIGFGKHGWAPVKMAATGAIAIALVSGVPVLGGLITLLVASVGLGALILTRFGTRPYPYLTMLNTSTQPPVQ